ncbi:PP2C family protein-serine/threonine phosphatase [Virgibacillus senegalensis]|uniref:PP2C family protein-serine/threonine phosphatase n=1 Tax=Virgibacillus senegalensis TaxID=1499679 RepID=UPI000B2F3D56|nr:PP2C family protein-serine/threonine phosphatase [Virgibacillus senegalensis]
MKLLNAQTPTVDKGEVAGISIPARLIGGDYYDFYLLPNGNLRIVIGDVMGKGIPAAMLMILTRGAFRSAAESTQGPSETLTAMNKAMYDDLRTLGSFVTVMCADWNPHTKTLTYSSAGHNFPVIVKANNQLVEVPETKGVMLGGLPEAVYKDDTVQLEDDLVFFYTDGITEARNKDGEMYQLERLKKTLLKHHSYDVKEVEAAIVEEMESFTEGLPQRDDITMVLLKTTGSTTNITSYTSPLLHT